VKSIGLISFVKPNQATIFMVNIHHLRIG